MIKTFFRIIRWPNLLIIAFSMYLMYDAIVRRFMVSDAAQMGMQWQNLFMLITATIFIAAGGYIINDIVDQSADQINKPGKNAIGTIISAKKAKTLYIVITVIGVISGSAVAFSINTAVFSLLFVFTAGLMWFYAKDYQCRPLLGNIIIAILSALSFGLVFIVQLLTIKNQTQQIVLKADAFDLALKATLIYTTFAFLTTLIREIVKDIEDYSGDTQVGCNTYAVQYGTKKANTLALIISFLGLATSFFIQWIFYTNGLMLLFFYFFLIDFLFGLVIYRLSLAKEKKDYSSLSLSIKLLMLTGILSMALFFFQG